MSFFDYPEGGTGGPPPSPAFLANGSGGDWALIREHAELLHMLWPIAVNQAEVAARNAVGADELRAHVLPVALLKGIGMDLLSVGRFAADEEAGEEAIILDQGSDQQYARLALSAEGRVEGGLLLNHGPHHGALIAAVKDEADVSGVRDQLRAGELAAMAPAASPRPEPLASQTTHERA